MSFKNWKIKNKLFILIVVNMLFLISVGSVGSIYINKMANASDEMFNDRLVSVKNLLEMRGNYRSAASSSLEYSMTDDEDRRGQLEQTINDLLVANNEILAYYEKTQPRGEMKEVFSELKTNNLTYDENLRELININKTQGAEAAWAYAQQNFNDVRIATGELADNLIDLNVQAAEQTNLMNKENQHSASIIMTALTILSIVVAFIIGYFIIRLITKPLKEMQELMQVAEQGDFTKIGTYESKDEIGSLMNSLNGMLQGLRSLMFTIFEKSETLAASSEQLSASADLTSKASENIADTIQGLAEGTNRQINSVAATAKVMEHMAEGVDQTTITSQNIAEASVATSEKAQEGYEIIEKAIKQMNSISKTVSGLGEMVRNLGERSKEIGSITMVINEVSSQTNLLALNAAIEAARAGEHGRGFAVVADEVKQLAERTTESSSQISKLIDSIHNETQLAVSSMKQASDEVIEGIETVNNAGATFEQIHQGIKTISSNLLEVSAAIQQISASTDDVKQSIHVVSDVVELTVSSGEQVSSATEEQLASMQEIASTSIDLSRIAEELQLTLSKFKI